MQRIEKNNGPRTTCFLMVWRRSLLNFCLKGVHASKVCKKSSKSCLPIFVSIKIVVCTIPAQEKCYRNRAYYYFCSVLEGLIHVYHYYCNACSTILKENQWTWTISLIKIVPGFFIMVFCHIFIPCSINVCGNDK